MSKLTKWSSVSFVSIIVILTYLPLLFMLVFSFSTPSSKGFYSFTSFTNDGTGYPAYVSLFTDEIFNAVVNSTIVALLVVAIIIPLSLLIVYGLWRQRQRAHRIVVEGLANISLINPDIITALGLGILFTAMFGTFTLADEGIYLAVISHVVTILPFITLTLFPRSEKFNASQFKASQDLGYGKFKTWTNTYLVHMRLPLIMTALITVALSFDDFILARITSNVNTLGVTLYSTSTIQGWAIALGGLLLIATLLGNMIFIVYKVKKSKQSKIVFKDNIFVKSIKTNFTKIKVKKPKNEVTNG